ncbi:MAG: tRNA (cytidine(34)-2'-O)-methyltransferase [Acidobacteriota bacterium]
MQVVLVEPQIPPNTGSVARLCAATEIPLHLVGRLGFHITDRHLKRAGLDYWEFVEVHRHDSLEGFLARVPASRLRFFSKKAPTSYLSASFHARDRLIFGSETTGLPDWLFGKYPDRFYSIPIFHPSVRSLNLAASVAIVVYEALRQTGRMGAL